MVATHKLCCISDDSSWESHFSGSHTLLSKLQATNVFLEQCSNNYCLLGQDEKGGKGKEEEKTKGGKKEEKAPAKKGKYCLWMGKLLV